MDIQKWVRQITHKIHFVEMLNCSKNALNPYSEHLSREILSKLMSYVHCKKKTSSFDTSDKCNRIVLVWYIFMIMWVSKHPENHHVHQWSHPKPSACLRGDLVTLWTGSTFYKAPLLHSQSSHSWGKETSLSPSQILVMLADLVNSLLVQGNLQEYFNSQQWNPWLS